jgi:chromosome segregation ATPase
MNDDSWKWKTFTNTWEGEPIDIIDDFERVRALIAECMGVDPGYRNETKKEFEERVETAGEKLLAIKNAYGGLPGTHRDAFGNLQMDLVGSQEKLEAAQQKHTELEQTVQDRENALTTSKTRMKTLTTQVGELQEEIHALIQKVQALASQVTDSEARSRELTTQTSVDGQEKERLKAINRDLENTVSETEQHFLGATATNEALASQVTDSEATIDHSTGANRTRVGTEHTVTRHREY